MTIVAACALVVRCDGLVLAVARRGTIDAWGLPGGKRDPAETPFQAAVRECMEETRAFFVPVEFVFTQGGVQTFGGSIMSTPRSGDAGPVSWVSWQALKDGPFGDYNAALEAAVAEQHVDLRHHQYGASLTCSVCGVRFPSA